MSDFIERITEEDIEELGLKIFRKSKNADASFIQICDSEGLLNDGTYACHYEILHMKKDDFSVKHKKNCVYVEIHFENKPYSKHFKTTIEELEKNDNELETFNWKNYCPGLRLKKAQFTIKDKKKVLKNLKRLKEKTIDHLLYKYKEIKSSKNWISFFSLENIAKRKTANKRALSKYISEPKEIHIVHEKIKKKLIENIKKNRFILGNEYEIDTSFLYEEHEVNKINYIDLVAKAKNQNKQEIIIFFEIKTVPDARLCIRQALGQLMEYSYFPKVKNAQKLIVVGTGAKTQEVQEYIDYLNDNFCIPIDYLQINLK